jgi:CubicO group peptidase (beta-lactamase class C family)
MKRLLIAIIPIMTTISACKNEYSGKYASLAKETDSLFSSAYQSPEEPGAEILIMKDDSVIFSKGYGVADIRTKSKIDENTFFNIASVSKQFSAVALLMLQEDGKLSLDDNLKKWFPQFKAPFFEKITLRHILSHSSGIPDSRDRNDRNFVLTATDEESYKYLENLDSLNFEPGTSYEYMNPTFQLMYTIIEKASGKKFDDFMRERIFDKADMTKTTYFEKDKFIPSMAHGYIPDSIPGKFKEYDYGEESFFATKADGGIYTSVSEFAKWELALRNNLLISEKSLIEAHSPHTIIDADKGEYYGYGWFVSRKPGFPEKIYHTGDNGGFQIYAGRYPSKKILYLIFANRNDKDREQLAISLDKILKNNGLLD